MYGGARYGMMSNVTFVNADGLAKTSTLFITGMAIALFSAAASAAAFLMLAVISAGGILLAGVGLCLAVPFAAFPSVSVLREERLRIASTRRALIVASGATAAVVSTVGTTLFFIGLIDSNVTTAILWPVVVSMMTFAWVLLCWGWVRLCHGRVEIVARDGCLACGYLLTGNQSGVCPECGTTILQNARTESSSVAP